MKTWTKDPIQRPQVSERIQNLVDDSNKKKLEATKHILTANKEMEIMVKGIRFNFRFYTLMFKL